MTFLIKRIRKAFENMILRWALIRLVFRGRPQCLENAITELMADEVCFYS